MNNSKSLSKKENLRIYRGKTISVKISDGEEIIYCIKNQNLKEGTYKTIGFICQKLEGWDFLANMVFHFLGGENNGGRS